MKFCIIGMGEVGKVIANGLITAGHQLHVFDPALHGLFRDKLLSSGVHVYDAIDDWIESCDSVLVCVNGSSSNKVSQSLLKHLHSHHVVFDFTTASPKSKKNSAAAVHLQGAIFLDAAIMGSVAMKGLSTKMLVSGRHEHVHSKLVIQSLKDAGMILQMMPDSNVGEAISLKLIRSLYTKSAEALAVQCLIAAEFFEVRDALYDSLEDLNDIPIKDFMNTLVTTHVVHAERRMKEVEEAKVLLHEAGVSTQIIDSVHKAFHLTTEKSEMWVDDGLPTIERALEILK